jgi:hypothetical protein
MKGSDLAQEMCEKISEKSQRASTVQQFLQPLLHLVHWRIAVLSGLLDTSILLFGSWETAPHVLTNSLIAIGISNHGRNDCWIATPTAIDVIRGPLAL